MPIWQFLVLIALLAGLLVCAGAYARILSRTIDRAGARLKRIEDALVVANDRLLKRTEAVPVEPTRAISVKGGRADYLSIPDLKGYSYRAKSQGSYSSSRRTSVAVPDDAGPADTIRSGTNGFDIERVDSFVTHADREEALEKGDEHAVSVCTDSSGSDLPSAGLSACDPPTSEDRAASSELRNLAPVPAEDAATEAKADSDSDSRESVAKQNRDALLIMSNQRRRRRTRLGY